MKNNSEMTNEQMKKALKTRINEACTGKMTSSQLKNLNNSMLNQIRFSKDEMEYKKLTNSKKKMAIYE